MKFRRILLPLSLLLVTTSCANESVQYEYKGIYYSENEISKETIEWLAVYNSLSEEEQRIINFMPSDLSPKYDAAHTFNFKDLELINHKAEEIEIINTNNKNNNVLKCKEDIKTFVNWFNKQVLWLSEYNKEETENNKYFIYDQNNELEKYEIKVNGETMFTYVEINSSNLETQLRDIIVNDLVYNMRDLSPIPFITYKK